MTAADDADLTASVAAAAAAQPAPTDEDILKSPQDRRLYRRLVLPNGMMVLLIHDPEMAAAVEGAEENEGASEDGSDEVSRRLC